MLLTIICATSMQYNFKCSISKDNLHYYDMHFCLFKRGHKLMPAFYQLTRNTYERHNGMYFAPSIVAYFHEPS